MGWRAAAEWVGFQAVWFACALGAAQGLNWPGIAAAAAFVGLVLVARGRAHGEVVGVLASGLVGAVAESALVTCGLVRYGAASPDIGLGLHMAPVAIIALWCAFGAALPALAALLGTDRPIRAGAIGAVTGPLAYLGGARLDALSFPAGTGPAVVALVLAWGLALPLLLCARSRALTEHA